MYGAGPSVLERREPSRALRSGDALYELSRMSRLLPPEALGEWAGYGLMKVFSHLSAPSNPGSAAAPCAHCTPIRGGG